MALVSFEPAGQSRRRAAVQLPQRRLGRLRAGGVHLHLPAQEPPGPIRLAVVQSQRFVLGRRGDQRGRAGFRVDPVETVRQRRDQAVLGQPDAADCLVLSERDDRAAIRGGGVDEPGEQNPPTTGTAADRPTPGFRPVCYAAPEKGDLHQACPSMR